jgi:hypothetical protein
MLNRREGESLKQPMILLGSGQNCLNASLATKMMALPSRGRGSDFWTDGLLMLCTIMKESSETWERWKIRYH